MDKKRITIYLDLNIKSDEQIWRFFEGKRKNEIIRPVLSSYINGNMITTPGESLSEDETEWLNIFKSATKEDKDRYLKIMNLICDNKKE